MNEKVNLRPLQEIKELRMQLPPYDSAPTVKELTDLQTVKYPENPNLEKARQDLQQEFSIDSLIEKLDPEPNTIEATV